LPRLVLASRNKGKLREIKELLADLSFELVGLDQFSGLPEINETGESFAANALLKARIIGDFIGEPTLADDSGLEVAALNGEPGIYSARYGQPGWSDRQRYEFLLQKLAGLPFDQRTARFRSTAVFYDPATGQTELTEGEVTGVIVAQPKGVNGFGYDPVFFLPELGKTMAELPELEKNRISHRARAIIKIKPILAVFYR